MSLINVLSLAVYVLGWFFTARLFFRSGVEPVSSWGMTDSSTDEEVVSVLLSSFVALLWPLWLLLWLMSKAFSIGGKR